MQKILVTGAGGFLGKYLIDALLKKNEYEVLALDLSKEQLVLSFASNDNILFFDSHDLERGAIRLNEVNVVIHLAFGRAHKGAVGIANSLSFTKNLFNQVYKSRTPCLINISSQEVYGFDYKAKRIEDNDVSPQSIYGMAKFASELLITNSCSENKISACSIRLAGLIGKESESRMVNKFVKNAIESKPIRIVGGSQVFSQLDVRDAANGLVALLQTPPQSWKPIYNLGYIRSYSIMEIAETVAAVARKFICAEVDINVEKTDEIMYAEMDSSLFYNDTQWQPQYDMTAIVESIFEYKLLQKNNINYQINNDKTHKF